MTPPSSYPSIDVEDLKKRLEEATNDKELFATIVDAPFKHKVEAAFLFLGIIVFLLVDKEANTINRIALSDTDLAKNTLKVSAVPFNKIKIPLNHEENIISHAIKAGEPRDTTDWRFLFVPALQPDEARINQASAGIAYSAVYPLKARDGGALIFSYYQYEQEIGLAQRNFMSKYTTLVSNALKA